MQIYPEAEPFTHLAKVPFGVKQYKKSLICHNFVSFAKTVVGHSWPETGMR